MKDKLKRLIRQIAKEFCDGIIYGEMVNANGGGVWIRGALTNMELS